MQMLDSRLIEGKQLSFQHHVPLNRDGVRVLGGFHSGHEVFETRLSGDAQSLRRRGGTFPIYMRIPFLTPELLNRSSLMPHIGIEMADVGG